MMRRLHPDPSSITPEDATTGLRLGELAPAERPYLVLNMISAADGAATLGGRTRALGDDVDRAVFHGLRTQADCVMVGAGTARIERYGRLVRDPDRRERRRAEGLAADPLACIVSGTLDLPADLPLLQDPDSRVVLITGGDGELAGVTAHVEYMRPAAASATRPTLTPFLRRLRSEHNVRSILCEGGPRLNSSLLAEDLVDELFLTISPKLVGGTPEITIVAGPPPPEAVDLDLVTCHEAAGSLYMRYRKRR
jgi:riboflavin biosynthesis pyrimidine reductase